MNETELLERRIGTTLRGKWTLERLFGFGGMAAVYIGQHKIGRRDAIKILHPEVAAHKEIARRFEQDAHAVNRFQHPGAVQTASVAIAPAPSVRTPNPPRRGKEVWVALGGIALMLVVLGIAILVRLGRHAPEPEATLATDPPPNATPSASAASAAETNRSSRASGPLPDRRGARQPRAPTTTPPGRAAGDHDPDDPSGAAYRLGMRDAW